MLQELLEAPVRPTFDELVAREDPAPVKRRDWYVGRRDAPPTIRNCSSLDESIFTTERLYDRYGRSISSNWIVGYIQGYVDFVAQPAAADYALLDPATRSRNWPVLYDRVVAMLERGEAAHIILFNEVRQRAGASTLPVPPPV